MIRSSIAVRFVRIPNRDGSCTADSNCLAYESDQYIMCWCKCFGLQFGWSGSYVNVIRTVRMTCIHCGLSVDFYWSEPNDPLRIKRYMSLTGMSSVESELISNRIEWFGGSDNFFLTCQKKFQTLPYRPVRLRAATHHTLVMNQIHRIFPNRCGKVIRRDSYPARHSGFSPLFEQLSTDYHMSFSIIP